MWQENLIDKITTDLALEVGATNSEIEVLRLKVKYSLKAVMRTRNYQPHHTDSFIEKDIQQYEENIHDLALYDYNQIGAEGQASHGENGYSRTWKDRESCLIGVIPFIGSVGAV